MFAAMAAPVVLSALAMAWKQRRADASWRVRRITNPRDRRIRRAIEIWQDREIPLSSMAGEDVIRDWIRRKSRKPTEYLLVVQRRRDIAAAMWCTHYPESKILFINYLAYDREYKEPGAVRLLIDYIVKNAHHGHFRGCTAVVFEVDRPLADGDAKRTRMAVNRQRLFERHMRQHGLTGATIDIDYRQPPLTPDAELVDEPLLLYAWHLVNTPAETTPEAEARRVIEFVYDVIYGDISDTAETYTPEQIAAFRQRLEAMKAANLAQLAISSKHAA
ncbi:hypothetical protein BH11PLA2_BH11PLA2_43750 [soil metagenome]